jgi:ABC-type Fe3+ transport system substrate-binding protein
LALIFFDGQNSSPMSIIGLFTQSQAQVFIDFALSNEGQAIVKNQGWIPAR